MTSVNSQLANFTYIGAAPLAAFRFIANYQRFHLINMMAFLSILIAYLIGGIPFGYLLTRWKTGHDVRTLGSGNIGATNVLRTAGTGLGIATLLLDILKGYVAVWIT